MFIVSYYRDKALEWIQPYIIEYMEKGWTNRLSADITNLLNPDIFITQLQTMFGEIDPKQKAEGKLLYLK